MSCRREATFEGRPESVRQVRLFLANALAGLPAPVIDDAVLCGSELATNAIGHLASGRPGGRFHVVADVGPACVRIHVTDEGGPTEPVLLPATDDDTGHRGLPLITRLGALQIAGDTEGRCVSARISLGRVR